MNNFFDQAFDYLIDKDEGDEFTNKPSDKGGPTKYGITKRTLENYLDREVSLEEMKNLKPEVAKEVYLHNYWDPNRCGQYKSYSVALSVFTSGVLYGTITTANLVQRVCNILGGALKIDGDIGDKTLAILNILKPEDFLKTFHGLVLLRIDLICKTDPNQEVNRGGWTNRANRLLSMSKLDSKTTKVA